MKRVLAVALLLLTFASAALADGIGLPPAGKTPKPHQAGVVRVAD
jgi:hypothetical protein